MIATLTIALGIPFLLGLGFTVLLFLARRPNREMVRITIPEKDTFFDPDEKMNGTFQL